MKQLLLLMGGIIIIHAMHGTNVQLNRLRIMFINQAPEAALVWIGKKPLQPRIKDIIQHGESKWLFPPALTSEKVVWIRIDCSQEKFEGMLQLAGSGSQSLTYACRAFGSVELVQGGTVIASIGAGTIDRGIVLILTPEYKLELYPLIERGPNRRRERKQVQRAAYLDLPVPFCLPCSDRITFIKEHLPSGHK